MLSLTTVVKRRNVCQYPHMADPILELDRRLAKAKTYRALEAELGVSAGHLCHVLKGNREPGEKLLKALGFEAETRVTYRRKRA